MSDAGVVIVGAGFAAGELAVKLRQAGYQSPITVIGAEKSPPYHRPPLSKAYFGGSLTADALLLRPAQSYRDLDITLRLGTEVVGIDRAARRVSLAGDAVTPYDRLVLATGGRARRLSCPGAALDGVHTLRTMGDVDAIRSAIRPGLRVVMVGGGYVGLETAAIARGLGCAVTVIEAAPRLLARVTGPEISAFYAAAHRDAGVEILTGASVCALSPDGADAARVGGVMLTDGRMIPADLVIVGIGLLPSTELAEAAGLAVENGILVDEFCRTADPAVLAIGDCANHPSPFLGRRVRLESVPNALEQARVAAATITGTLSPYAAIPWFWSDQYDLKLQAVGLVGDHDQVVLRGDPASRSFIAFYLRDGRVMAADAVNRAGDFVTAKKLVADRRVIAPDRLADDTQKLKFLLAPVAA